MNSEHNQIKEKYGLQRGFGLLQATALNMSNMVGHRAVYYDPVDHRFDGWSAMHAGMAAGNGTGHL